MSMQSLDGFLIGSVVCEAAGAKYGDERPRRSTLRLFATHDATPLDEAGPYFVVCEVMDGAGGFSLFEADSLGELLRKLVLSDGGSYAWTGRSLFSDAGFKWDEDELRAVEASQRAEVGAART